MLGKIDAILTWEQRKETERGIRHLHGRSDVRNHGNYIFNKFKSPESAVRPIKMALPELLIGKA